MHNMDYASGINIATERFHFDALNIDKNIRIDIIEV